MGKSNVLSEVGAERPRYSILENSGSGGNQDLSSPDAVVFQEHHYLKAELGGLTASGSCSSKVQNDLASL